MEIKIVTRKIKSGMAIVMYVDEKEHLNANIGDLGVSDYERLRALVAGAVYEVLAEMAEESE